MTDDKGIRDEKPGRDETELDDPSITGSSGESVGNWWDQRRD